MAKRKTVTKRVVRRKATAEPASAPESTGWAESGRAEVVLDVECSDGAAHLILVNTGSAAAVEVTVAFSCPLRGIGHGVHISELPLFKGLGLLRPGREFRVLWDSAPRLFERKPAPAFEAVVTWRDSAGRQWRARYRHDLEIFRELPETFGAWRRNLPPRRPQQDETVGGGGGV